MERGDWRFNSKRRIGGALNGRKSVKIVLAPRPNFRPPRGERSGTSRRLDPANKAGTVTSLIARNFAFV